MLATVLVPPYFAMLISVLFTLVVLGVALWLIERYVPMAEPVKVIIRVILVLVLIWWLLRQVGIM